MNVDSCEQKHEQNMKNGKNMRDEKHLNVQRTTESQYENGMGKNKF